MMWDSVLGNKQLVKSTLMYVCVRVEKKKG